MQRRGNFQPMILFTGDLDFAYEYALCEKVGLEHYIHATGSEELPRKNVPNQITVVPERDAGPDASVFVTTKQRLKSLPALGPLVRMLYGFYVRCLITKSSLLSLPWHLIRLKKLSREARTILRRVRPDVIVSPNIQLGALLGFITIEAERFGIPTAVIPYAWILRAETLSILKAHQDHQVKGPIKRWVSRKYPQWNLHNYLCLPAVQILAMEWLRLPTAAPWMTDDIADFIALESDAMLRSYLEDGGSAQKCSVTGSATHDILARLVGKQNRGNGYILSFLPPDQTAHQLPGYEYQSYWDMLTFWIKTLLANDSLPVIFALHPRMKNLKHSLRNRFPNMNIVEGDSCEAIPDAKFCVGFSGGILRCAICCSKPILHYDVFNYRMNEFASVPSVVTVNKRAAFVESYVRLSTDPDYLSTLEREARVIAREWGILDGCAVARIEKSITTRCLQAAKPHLSRGS